MKKICKHCGKEFTTENSNQTYCNNKCKTDFYYQKKRKVKSKTTQCIECKNEIFTKDRRKFIKKFCSNECFIEYSKTKTELPKCSVCGNIYTPTKELNIWCSRQCRNKIRKGDLKSTGAVDN